jgi:hypothetical protein
MNYAPGSRPTDRVRANNWLQRGQVIRAVEELKWSFAALLPIVGTPGSNEREIFELAVKGFRHKVDYIADSLDRLLEEKGQT